MNSSCGSSIVALFAGRSSRSRLSFAMPLNRIEVANRPLGFSSEMKQKRAWQGGQARWKATHVSVRLFAGRLAVTALGCAVSIQLVRRPKNSAGDEIEVPAICHGVVIVTEGC